MYIYIYVCVCVCVCVYFFFLFTVVPFSRTSSGSRFIFLVVSSLGKRGSVVYWYSIQYSILCTAVCVCVWGGGYASRSSVMWTSPFRGVVRGIVLGFRKGWLVLGGSQVGSEARLYAGGGAGGQTHSTLTRIHNFVYFFRRKGGVSK